MIEPLPWPEKTDRLIFDELDSTMAEEEDNDEGVASMEDF